VAGLEEVFTKAKVVRQGVPPMPELWAAAGKRSTVPAGRGSCMGTVVGSRVMRSMTEA
jgi:hypothetical protein